MAINKNFIVDAGIEVPTTVAVGNTTVRVTINSTSFSGTSNNSTNFAGQPASFYANATNLTDGTLDSTRLPDTGITPGTYGSASVVPVLTLDTKGRVAAVSTSSIAGVTNFTYTPSNTSFTIAVGTGSAFVSTIAAANSTTKGVMEVVDSTSNNSTTVAAAARSVATTYTYAGSIAGTAYANAVSVAAADATSKVATAYANATAYSSVATNLTSGTVNPARLGSGTASASTYLAGDNTWKAITQILQAVYPVGSVYINGSTTTNPAVLFGFGTWVEVGVGRVLVGQNTGDGIFTNLGQQGGTKDATLVSHYHDFSGWTSWADLQGNVDFADRGIPNFGTSGIISQFGTSGQGQFGSGAVPSGFTVNASHNHYVSGSTDWRGSSATNANLPPYLVVKIWQRIA